MFTLYSMQRSGNCYKVRLALAQLDIAYRLVEIDILKGETRTPDFLAKNPSGHVPLLEAAPGRYLPESGAILWYLAVGSPLAPEGFDYVYENVKRDINLASISGGTDIISTFVLGNPVLPVWCGEGYGTDRAGRDRKAGSAAPARGRS